MEAAGMGMAPTTPIDMMANRKTPSPTASSSPNEIRKAAQDLEAMFLGQMFNHMFSGIKTDGPFGGGHAEKMFQSLLVQEYGKVIASQGGIGIADQIERQLLGLQEVK